MTIDGVRGSVSPSPKRVWHVKMAFGYLARCPRVSGDGVLRLLGHATYLFLFRPGLLSIFRHVYDFAALLASTLTRLWPGAAREARWVAAFVLLACSDLRCPWGPRVVCSDAYGRLWGCRVATRETQIGRHMQYRERWRFAEASAES